MSLYVCNEKETVSIPLQSHFFNQLESSKLREWGVMGLKAPTTARVQNLLRRKELIQALLWTNLLDALLMLNFWTPWGTGSAWERRALCDSQCWKNSARLPSLPLFFSLFLEVSLLFLRQDLHLCPGCPHLFHLENRVPILTRILSPSLLILQGCKENKSQVSEGKTFSLLRHAPSPCALVPVSSHTTLSLHLPSHPQSQVFDHTLLQFDRFKRICDRSWGLGWTPEALNSFTSRVPPAARSSPFSLKFSSWSFQWIPGSR